MQSYPKLAHDTEGSIAEAQRFFATLNRPNVLIKIRGAKEGVPAVEECLDQGININITLLFVRQAYQDVARAYIRALARRAAEGKPLECVASVASFLSAVMPTAITVICISQWIKIWRMHSRPFRI